MCTVETQLTVGAKVLSFTCGPLTFKDSLCFLKYPLSSFPNTFGNTELKKGFFPHASDTRKNQQYVGRIPELEFYDPVGKSAKEKKELEGWHADQERRNDHLDFAQEMEVFSKSDVALLEAGGETFAQEFESHAKFNPFE